MKKIKIIPFLLLIAMLASVFAPGALAVEPYDAPELTAAAAILADMDTGAFYVSKNAESKAYPASLTKILKKLCTQWGQTPLKLCKLFRKGIDRYLTVSRRVHFVK